MDEHADVAFMEVMLVAFEVIVELVAKLSMLVNDVRHKV